MFLVLSSIIADIGSWSASLQGWVVGASMCDRYFHRRKGSQNLSDRVDESFRGVGISLRHLSGIEWGSFRSDLQNQSYISAGHLEKLKEIVQWRSEWGCGFAESLKTIYEMALIEFNQIRLSGTLKFYAEKITFQIGNDFISSSCPTIIVAWLSMTAPRVFHRRKTAGCLSSQHLSRVKERCARIDLRVVDEVI